MINLALLREKPEEIIALLQKKDPHYNARSLFELDQQMLDLKLHVEQLRKQKNDLAQEGKKGVTPALIEQSKSIGLQLKEHEQKLAAVELEFSQLYLRAPNIPAPEVPQGNKESNAQVKEFGAKPTFAFDVKNHVQLGTALGWFDTKAAAAMTGNNFVLYRHDAVRLIYALLSFMLKHNRSRGFELVLPPTLVNERSLEISGNFPKFKDEVYPAGDNLYLIPTSEVPLTNLYRDTIFLNEQLPLRLTAATSCFRREAGGYGAKEQGLIRIHQFEKAEIYTFCAPEDSMKQLEYMLETAESLLQQLGLHYRVMLLAAQDTSFQSAKTYDIEIWMPSQERYIEVSSCSNCTDFQARRGAMRYRVQQGQKTQYVHTLNGSSLALPRLIAALMETYQEEDGTIKLPALLEQYDILK